MNNPEFWTVGETKEDNLRCYLGLWDTVMSIF